MTHPNRDEAYDSFEARDRTRSHDLLTSIFSQICLLERVKYSVDANAILQRIIVKVAIYTYRTIHKHRIPFTGGKHYRNYAIQSIQASPASPSDPLRSGFLQRSSLHLWHNNLSSATIRCHLIDMFDQDLPTKPRTSPPNSWEVARHSTRPPQYPTLS